VGPTSSWCLQQVDASTTCHSVTRGVICHISRSP
jgi:hypothetical protein